MMIGDRFEYRLCISQNGKITFVNETWQGTFWGDQEDANQRNQMYESCPKQAAYLQQAGQDGWELVAAYVLNLPDGQLEKFIFKRSK